MRVGKTSSVIGGEGGKEEETESNGAGGFMEFQEGDGRAVCTGHSIGSLPGTCVVVQ